MAEGGKRGADKGGGRDKRERDEDISGTFWFGGILVESVEA